MAGLEHPELPGSQARLGFKDCAGARARRGIQAWVVPGEWMWSESREIRAYLAPRAKSDALDLRDQKALRFFVSACFVSSSFSALWRVWSQANVTPHRVFKATSAFGANGGFRARRAFMARYRAKSGIH